MVLAVADLLNSREKAASIWAVLVLLYILWKDPSIARSILTTVRSLFAPKLSLLWALAAGYTAGIVFAAQTLNLWHTTAIKETAYWFAAGGTVLTGKAVIAPAFGRAYAKRLARNAVRFTIVVEFLVNLYVMPLAAELVVVPVIALFLMVQVVADNDANLGSAKTVADATLALVGFGTLTWVIVSAATDLHSLFTREHAEGLLIAPALTLAFVPFLYAVWRWSRREQDRLARRWRSGQFNARAGA